MGRDNAALAKYAKDLREALESCNTDKAAIKGLSK